eukprot:s74_g9.t1
MAPKGLGCSLAGEQRCCSLAKALKLQLQGCHPPPGPSPRPGLQPCVSTKALVAWLQPCKGPEPAARGLRYLFGNGSLDDALAVFDGYDAAMDEPVMLMYEEIMAAFPEAKFLLTISDAESWFENYVEISKLLRTRDSFNMSAVAFWGSLPSKCTEMRSWGCNFHTPSPEDKDTCLKNYYRHIQRVQDVIPPERLLVYNWSDGWSPLSHFLGTRVPEEQFPHEDSVRSRAEGDLWDLTNASKAEIY